MINEGEQIRALRKAHGLSVVQLAKKSGVSRQQVYNIENGTSGASLFTYQLIMAVFGLEVVVQPMEGKR